MYTILHIPTGSFVHRIIAKRSYYWALKLETNSNPLFYDNMLVISSYDKENYDGTIINIINHVRDWNMLETTSAEYERIEITTKQLPVKELTNYIISTIGDRTD